MANEKAFGIPISPAVYSQLEIRKAALKGKDDRVTDLNMMLHNKGSFVRVVSSVDTDYNSDDKFTSELASNFILQGGILKKTKGEDGKVQFKPREGLRLFGDFLSEDDVSSYTYDTNTGYRPMAGIDSITVQSQGSFGTTKKANIGFTVWSLEQLDAMEKLYFRPGFNVLVEYGAASYIDSKTGKIETYQTSLAEAYLNKTKSLAKLQEDISSKEEETSYNYTAFLGRIINFSWSYNTDGGFDCSMTIQAKGEIVESLELLMTDNKKSGLDNYISSTSSKTGDFTFLKALKVLKKDGDNKQMLKKYLKDRKGENVDEAKYYLERSNGFNIAGLEEVASGDDSKYEPGKGYNNTFAFINLGGLLSLCNNFLIPENEDGEKETFFRIERYEKEKSSTYLTFPGHVGLNPGVCMLPINTEKGVFYSDKEMYGGTPNELSKSTSLEVDNIYHILINVDLLINIVEGFVEAKIDNSSSSSNVFSFIKKVLSDISTNLGGINEFDLDLDKRANEWRVLDRNHYDPEKTGGDKFSTLDLVGLGSLVTSFKLESKISGELSNSLAIAAAASGENKSASGISRYNTGVVDRFKKTLKTGPGEEISTEEDKASDKEKENEITIDYGAKVIEVYQLYTKTKKWDRNAFRNAASNHRQFTERTLKHYQSSLRQSGEKVGYKGIIPVDLNFSMDGISGLKVGEAFKIQNNILPSRYHNSVGFVITSISDSINTDNVWKTEIGTKMFNLPSTEEPDPSFQAAQEKVKKQKEERKIKLAETIADSKRQQAIYDQYGKPGDQGNLVKMTVPPGMNLTYNGVLQPVIRGVHTQVATKLQNAFKEIVSVYGEQRIKDLNIRLFSGVYSNRKKRGGTTTSLHSWGIAIDLYRSGNLLKTPSPTAKFSQPEYKQMVDIFERNGWYSLGRAKNYDFMHFQTWDPRLKESDGSQSSHHRLAGEPYGASSSFKSGWEKTY